jgi:hypothetical protein
MNGYWVPVFWVAAVGSAYSYFFYPLVLLLLPRWRTVEPTVPTQPPFISVIIAARNEARGIRAKLQQTLGLNYPRDRLEILVASDASDDDTDQIVAGFADQGVRLARNDNRGGKEAAQANAIRHTRGDVLVFTDCATRLDIDALQRIAAHFWDPDIGAVSSTDKLIPAEGGSSGEGAYVRFEMWLRSLESARAGLVGLSGSLFAVRREVAQVWPTHVPSDATAALRTARIGLHAIADPLLLGHYADIQNPAREYQRKVRTVLRGMAAVSHNRALLNPLAFPAFAAQLWGHKVMRWLVPWFLLLLFVASSVLAVRKPVSFYGLALAAQLGLYGTALIVALVPSCRRFGPARLAHYLVQVHWGMLDAGVRFLRGERIVTWDPSVRKP